MGVRCAPEAVRELLRALLGGAIPFRGFRPRRLSAGPVMGERGELLIELQPASSAPPSNGVTPWMTSQQMARDLGGTLELHSGEPPFVKLHLPVAR